MLDNIAALQQHKDKQAAGGQLPRYAAAQDCKWWHDIRHVRIWIDHHYCCSHSTIALKKLGHFVRLLGVQK